MGGAALIDRPDSESSRPEGLAGPEGGGVTAESCTWKRQEGEMTEWLPDRRDHVQAHFHVPLGPPALLHTNKVPGRLKTHWCQTPK